MKKLTVGNIEVVLGETQIVRSFDAAVVILFLSGKLVLVKNKERAWEFPGGHREGCESYLETAEREAHEEVGAKIKSIKYLGYYTTQTGHVTVITRAEVSSFPDGDDEHGILDIGIYDSLPPGLSFGDGREQLFLNYAIALRSGNR